MPFDDKTRNRLREFVGAARKLLTEEFTRQLQNQYGMDPKTGEVTDLSKLTHLDSTSREIAQLLRTTLEHYRATSPASATSDLLDRIVREQAFTVLNRLCALRLAEARTILIESVARGYQSQGFQLYVRVANGALGSTGETYRTYLFSIFDELAVDLPLLFYRYAPQGRLFPGEKALLDLLDLINHDDLRELWTEDETIGWIYQFFNSVEERKKMRDESAAPRNSREMAVRNQFFTPRYVVEFLTENTLGRIWYEMRKGQTALVDQCQYFVRRPSEAFLEEGQEPPADNSDTSGLSQEELWKQPVYVPQREQKDPRDLKLLDPAMGSGHFLLYAFDLLEVIYREAWEQDLKTPSEVTGRTLREDYPSEEALRRAIPELILRHNLHGVDIDPRAVQIAGLALWLRAQKSWKTAGVKPTDRPAIRKSNLVVAEPMPGEQDLLDEFLKDLKPALLGRLVRQVFDSMKLAGEAGTLLRIEDELQQEIDKARKEWQALRKSVAAGRPGVQTDIFGAATPEQIELELRQAELLEVSSDRFWHGAESRVLALLKEYAEKAENGTGTRRRLFAEDAAKGFALVSLLRSRYDVVLTNPPFGAASDGGKPVLCNSYSVQAEDLYCWFVERGCELSPGGLIGVISSDSFLKYTDYSKYRNFLINGSLLTILLDLGWEVLDSAYVSAACYILNPLSAVPVCHFADLTETSDKCREVAKVVAELNGASTAGLVYTHSLPVFRAIDGSPFCFWFSDAFFKWAHQAPKIRDLLVDHGIGAGPHNFFFRANWEIPHHERRQQRRWPPLVNGGMFSPYYRDDYLCIDWRGDGSLIKAHLNHIYPYLNGNIGIKVQREHVYYRPGLTYGKRSDRFNAQILPAGAIPSFEGIGMYPENIEDSWWLLAFLNSRFVAYYLNLTCGLHKNAVYVDRVPVPAFSVADKQALASSAKRLYSDLRAMNSLEEISNRFLVPAAVISIASTVRDSVSLWRQTDRSNEVEVWSEQSRVERIVSNAVPTFPEISEAVIKDQGSDPLTLSSVDELDEVPSEVANDLKVVCRPLVNRDDSSMSTDAFRLAISRGIIIADACKLLNSASFLDQNELQHHTEALVSYCLGVAFGRWDIRCAIDAGRSARASTAGPFETLPICRPGELQNKDGVPSRPGDVPPCYPIKIQWVGILADDAGHPYDILAGVRQVIRVLWKERCERIEDEISDALGAKNIRQYFRQSGGFFANHLKLYSRSRRKAPIYWPLSVPSGEYTLWVYYHRLTDQTLLTAVNDFVEPKIAQVGQEIAVLRQRTGRTKKQEQELAALVDLEAELKDFREELLRIAKFWKPNLNDGVQITAAPLWRLFQHKPWQKILKETWADLEKGKYDWAHLSYSIWPDRVREKCKTDKSLAIVHGLEDLYQEPPASKKPRKKKTVTVPEEDEEI